MSADETNFVNIVVDVLKKKKLGLFSFIVVLDYVLRILLDANSSKEL